MLLQVVLAGAPSGRRTLAKIAALGLEATSQPRVLRSLEQAVEIDLAYQDELGAAKDRFVEPTLATHSILT